jgi:hypothetical protein
VLTVRSSLMAFYFSRCDPFVLAIEEIRPASSPSVTLKQCSLLLQVQQKVVWHSRSRVAVGTRRTMQFTNNCALLDPVILVSHCGSAGWHYPVARQPLMEVAIYAEVYVEQIGSVA